jgi:hypothetical protein
VKIPTPSLKGVLSNSIIIFFLDQNKTRDEIPNGGLYADTGSGHYGWPLYRGNLSLHFPKEKQPIQ